MTAAALLASIIAYALLTPSNTDISLEPKGLGFMLRAAAKKDSRIIEIPQNRGASLWKIEPPMREQVRQGKVLLDKRTKDSCGGKRRGAGGATKAGGDCGGRHGGVCAQQQGEHDDVR